LVFEVNQLKTELACKQVELESERQGCLTSKEALRAQIGELEQRKEDALAALKEASGKSDDYKRECEGISSTFCVLPLFLFL
jgi:chromosome segregation ATPase